MRTRPLVSILTPTYSRPDMLERAIRVFKAYTYPEREMVVGDDSPVPFGRISDPRIKYVRMERMSLGWKHNLLAGYAQGDVLMLQDDDDLFAPARISVQIEPMVLRGADITGIAMNFIRRESDGKFFHFHPQAKFKASNPTTTPIYRLFHDSNSAYTRKVWQSGVQYTNAMQAQKVHLLNDAIRAGFKYEAVPNEGGLFVYSRHGANTWQFTPRNLLACPEPSFAREAWFGRMLEAECAT